MADQRKQAMQASPLPSEAGEILREGGALVRLENETQMQIAVQRPRDEAVILESALAELDTYPDAAEEAIYSKPVGRLPECPKCGAETHYREKCPKCGADVPQKFAEGLSIRAAESLANRWRNSSFGAQIVGDDGTTVDGVAVFCDYEMNTRRAFPFRVSRQFKRKDGSVGRHQEDRFNDLVVRAALSKALREAIVRSLPAGLKHAYEAKAREVMAAKVGTDPDLSKRMLLKFSALGVTQPMVEKLIGRKVSEMTKADFIRLKGVANTIESGEMTAEAAFAGREEEAPPAGEGSKSRADELKLKLAAARAANPDTPRAESEPAGEHETIEEPGAADLGRIERARTLFPLGGEKPAAPEPEKPKRDQKKALSPEETSAQIQEALDKIGFDRDDDERKAFVAMAGGLTEALRIVQRMESATQLKSWMKFKAERGGRDANGK